jgi:RNA polymerase I-specific transcription initiation factor RRN7
MDENDAVASESPERKDTDSEGDDDDESEDGRQPDGEGEENDPELAALLQINSDSSSESEDEIDGEPKRQEQGKAKAKAKAKGRKQKGRQLYEMPASMIAVLIVACWTMRIPVMCHDFTRWARFIMEYVYSRHTDSRLIDAYELPYLDPVSRKLLPGDMVMHLTKHNIQTLSPFASLS